MPEIKTCEMVSRKEGGCTVQDIKVEVKCEILSDSIYKVLSVQSEAVITEKNLQDGEYKYGGKVNFFICYLDSEKVVRRYECEGDFTHELDVADNPRLFTTISVEKTETDLSGIKVALKAQLKVKTEIVYTVKTPCFENCENVIAKTQATEVSLYKGVNNVYAFNEEFSIPYAIEEVLCQRITPVIKSVTAGVGLINVECEAVLSVIALQSGEKKDIIREEKIFEFNAEIEADWVMPTDSAWLNIQKKSFKTDVFVDENGNKTDVNISATFNLEGETETRENVDIVVDAFSINDRTREERKSLNFMHFNGEYSERVNVFGAVDLGEELNAESLTVINCYVESLNNQENVISGVFGVNLLVKTENGLIPKKAEVPFEYTLKDNDKPLCFTALKPQVSLGDKLEIKGEVVITLLSCEPYSVTALTDIMSVGEKKKQTSAISVYIANSGEELWDLAKRLSVSPEVLSANNKDLEFPLSGKERIVVYRQL